VISVLVPTRNRPDNVRRLLDSAFDTAETEVEFIFYVDHDDPRREETLDVIFRHGGKVVYGGSEKIIMSQMWNICAEAAYYDVMMHCGDDIVFRTDGWDARVLEEFERYDDKIVFVHGRDGFQDANVGTHGFLHRNWIDTVGYLVPPYFSSDMNDLWLTEVADELRRRRYLPDVYTEHMHPAAGKADWDQTHQERLARHRRDDVHRIYRDHGAERSRDVEKLRAFIVSQLGAL
jgi:Glycosyl transferase family 2